MARISLRAYNHEIENLIERGQIEEAIAHCKNIIKQFPKHIETYRLLGKAYLESQRYSEAADILQRVLSVFPDDFVSQLGMSIIREDEGNLDAAIWHMERAYEVQPFNRAVQDELRRLYGRRDGVEPPRIRLTRGALVRMYARGDLYPQAIAEIRAALNEDSKRVDLLVLLSRMYYLSGQKIEATEICSSLITKLPYCYEANRILKDVLPETSRAEDAHVFQQRLFALDPYAAFISPNAPTSDQVPEQTVMVEKVEWEPGMTDAQTPDWARTIGVSWEEAPEEALPDWLNTITPEEPVRGTASEATAPETAGAETSAEDELIPDFMKDAGWQPSDGSAEETSVDFAAQEADAPSEEEPVEAEIPDWLKNLAPESAAGAGEAEAESEDQASLDWLEGILPAAEAAPANVAGEMEEPAGDATLPVEDTPESQAELEPQTSETPAVGEDAATDEPLPAWLQEMATAQESDQDQPASETPGEVSATDELPDWLGDLQSIPTTEEAAPIEDTQPTTPPLEAEETQPDWIQQAQEEEPGEAVVEAQPAEELPDWLKELSESEEPPAEAEEPAGEAEAPAVTAAEAPPETGQAASENLAEMDMDAAMAWMEALAAKQGAEEDSLKITAPEQRSEVTPEWLQQQAETPAEEAPTEEEPPLVDQISDAEAETVQATEEIPPVEAAETEEVTPSAEETATPVSQEAAPDLNDMDAAMAWMEALAAKQGAEEDSLKITTPEQRSETPPEWIQQAQAEEEPAIEAETGMSAENMPAPAEEEGQETGVAIDMDTDAAANAQPMAEEAAPVESATEPAGPPAWETEPVNKPVLDETQPEQKAEEVAGEIAEETADVPPAGEVPALAEESSERPSAQAEPPTQPVKPPAAAEEEIPEWLRSYEEEQQNQGSWKVDETLDPGAIADEQLPTWLREETGAQPPADEEPTEQTLSPTASADDLAAETEAPEWLKELQDQVEPEATPPETAEGSTWVPEYQPGAPTEETTPPAVEVPGDQLALARASLYSGDLDGAAAAYTECINTGERLEDIISDLQSALDQHPVDVSLWQALGDAYMRSDRIQDALDAYTKAEELLR